MDAHSGALSEGPNRTSRLGWLVALLALALIVGQLPPAARADDDINTVLRRIADLDRAIQVSRQNAERYRQASQRYQSAAAAASAKIAELAAKEQSAQSEAEELAVEIAIAEEQLALVTLQLSETIAYVSALAASLDEGTKLLARREELYGQHLRQMYRLARVTPLEMLLSSSSLADFAERIQLQAAIARQDQQLAADIRRLREANEERKAAAEVKQQEIEGLRLQISAQRDNLSEQKARLDDLIAATQDARYETEAQRQQAIQSAQGALTAARNQQAQAADLERQKLAAEALYAQLAARLQGSSGITATWSGKLATWPLSGSITSYYGPRRGGFHNGIDIAAPMYTQIRAAHSGLVQVVGKPYLASGDTAEVVVIAHASNMSTMYAHLDDRVRRPVVRPGQWVTAGQVIAYVGMTGWTTGPHLHFMTVYNGHAANPLPYLP